MNDFLDRLATRAIGSETMLTPRLPSLFEPLWVAPAMPLAPVAENVPDVRMAASTLPVAASKATAKGPVAANASMPRRAEPTPEASMRKPSTVRMVDSRVDVPPVAGTPSGIVPLSRDRDASTLSTVDRAKGVLRVAESTRHARMVGEPPARSSRRSVESGVLKPPPSPVFPSRPATTDGSGSAGARPSLSAGRGDSPASTVEQTVMVSIGRLEVRAAAGPSAQQRREAPKPGGLDDYLRQRGKVRS